MAQITAALVKELRERTGAGMMDCKKALGENDGDMELAIDWLRNKGLAAAAKKAGRVASEGLVGLASGDGIGVLAEVNSETDFVAKNETFQEFVKAVANMAMDAEGDFDKAMATAFPGGEGTLADEAAKMVGTIGENIQVRRMTALKANPGVVATYMHNATAAGVGKIGVLVGLKSEGDKDQLMALGKQLSMHIAATNPQAATTAELDPAIVEKERTFLIEQAKESGKTQEIAEKMVEGRIRKFFSEVVLAEQTFVIDNETKIAQVIENAAKEIGSPIELVGFARLELGEGIEKKEEDFAAEVAAVAAS
ncbi:MAG: elongation factor Ts [Alphaproteobacteria bacterium]|jgi:elongation factor Ts|nr:elongation factor Ts [Alphaproteobacteria bacterium]MBT4085770.1 elongation factor Ts [Alphaproteobacteria bacterium]MBT4543349.1 elongation factor Ts [Alphaproteobacteria bacterium]MBT7747115.1 elongation factor Ts [Alphaproteobacteria bacterium]